MSFGSICRMLFHFVHVLYYSLVVQVAIFKSITIRLYIASCNIAKNTVETNSRLLSMLGTTIPPNDNAKVQISLF